MTEEKIIKVLIVDDSPVAQSFLSFIIESDPHLKVIGIARNSDETLEFLKRETPDVITMDIVMPKMDGFDLTRKILKHWPIPIIVISEYYNRQDVEKCFRAMDAGALAILEKPRGLKDPKHVEMMQSIIETIKVMANVKISKYLKSHLEQLHPYQTKRHPKEPVFECQLPKGECPKKVSAIAIGGSIGGPQALSTILSGLSPDFPVPIFAVQHMSGGFIDGLIDWLETNSGLKVCLGRHGQKALPGYVYLAPDKSHMEVSKDNIITLSNGPAEGGFIPSIARLFRSVANAHGPEAVGILLSGIGSDGVNDLLYLKEKGGLTIAQDESSCVMFNKPSEAIQKGAVKAVIPLTKIAPMLMDISEKKMSSKRTQ